jgi:hypothetical protein
MEYLVLAAGLVAGIAGLLPAAAARAQAADAGGTETGGTDTLERSVRFDLALVNLFVLRNDADFDRGMPTYEENGRTEGMLGTFLQPHLAVDLKPHMQFYYETEIGLDLWSDRTPDAAVGGTPGESLSIKQREIWGRLELDPFSVKAGFQRVKDVTGLFINHWIGAARFGLGAEKGTGLFLTAGQLPDQTYEGWTWGDSFGNFGNDVLYTGLDGGVLLTPEVRLVAGGYYVHDGSLVDRTRDVGAAAGGVEVTYPGWKAGVSGMVQVGSRQNQAGDLSDEGILAWGATANGSAKLGIVTIDLALTGLSADDASEGNGALGFLYSGKRPGPSILLKENTTRDLGDNLDEKIGSYDGWFFEMRSGLCGLDLGVHVDALRWLRVGLVHADLLVVNPDNALGGRLVASENEVVTDIHLFGSAFRLETIGGVLIPGQAGAAYVNQLSDRTATDPIYFAQSAMIMNF